jgi:enoyl-CoA hydratase/carnithine racemase
MSEVLVERSERTLIITMNRPKVNAINHAMSRALYRAFDRLQNDRSLMVGILASANPRVFSAGWDLRDVVEGDYRPDDYFDPEYLKKYAGNETALQIEKGLHQNTSLKVIPAAPDQP